MKVIFIVVFIPILLLSCVSGDPLQGVRRLVNSSVRTFGKEDDLKKKIASAEYYKLAVNTMVEAYSSYSGINKDVALQLMNKKDYNNAVKHFEIALQSRITDSDIYYKLGICYAHIYRIERDNSFLTLAEENYKKALSIAPTNKDILYGYAHLLYYLKSDNTSAISVLQTIVQLTTSIPFPDAYFLLGRIYYENENYSEALKIYLDLLTINSKLNKEQKNKLEEFILQTRAQMGNK